MIWSTSGSSTARMRRMTSATVVRSLNTGHDHRQRLVGPQRGQLGQFGLGHPARPASPSVRSSRSCVRCPPAGRSCGSHPSSRRASVMSGQRRVGSSVGSGSKTTSDVDPVTSRTKCARSSIERSSGLPMLTGPVSDESSRASRPGDLVVDEAQAPRLAAVAVDGQGLAPQRLHDEVGHDPAVAGRQPRAVGVEDPGDAHVRPRGCGAWPWSGSRRTAWPRRRRCAARSGRRCPGTTRPGDAPRGPRRPRWCSP